MNWSYAIKKYEKYLSCWVDKKKVDSRINGIKDLKNQIGMLNRNDILKIYAKDWDNFIEEIKRQGINTDNQSYKDLRDCFFFAKKGYRCSYCGYLFFASNKYDIRIYIDHIVPQSKSVSKKWKYEKEFYHNLNCACHFCNTAKSNFDVETFEWWIKKVRGKQIRMPRKKKCEW